MKCEFLNTTDEAPMNIITELAEVWGARDKSISLGADGEVTNPLPYFEATFHLIQAAITQSCIARNCTYAELVEDIRRVDPDIIERFFELFDAVDCDVYGRWCSGSLTHQEYQRFCRTVDDWKEVTMRMIQTVKKG